MTFISGAYISGAHFVTKRAWALHHKLGQSELLTDPQLRHPDDSVEGQLWERKQGHEVTKSQVPEYASTTRLETLYTGTLFTPLPRLLEVDTGDRPAEPTSIRDEYDCSSRGRGQAMSTRREASRPSFGYRLVRSISILDEYDCSSQGREQAMSARRGAGAVCRGSTGGVDLDTG